MGYIKFKFEILAKSSLEVLNKHFLNNLDRKLLCNFCGHFHLSADMEIWCWSIALLLKISLKIARKAQLWTPITFSNKMSPPNPHDHVGHFESFISRFIPPFNPTRGSATVRSFFDFSHPFSCALLRASEKCWLMIGFWDGHLHKQCYQCCFKEENKHRIPIQLLSKCNFSQNKKHVFTWTLASEIWKFHPSFWDVFTNLSKKWNRNLPNQLNWLNFCAFSRLSFFPNPSSTTNLKPDHPYISADLLTNARRDEASKVAVSGGGDEKITWQKILNGCFQIWTLFLPG